MSVLGAHVHSLLKPLGLQHRLRGTSVPPKVARHTNALLTLENLLVGSNSCRTPGWSETLADCRPLSAPTLQPHFPSCTAPVCAL